MFNVLQNQLIQLDPVVEARDTGWYISGVLASHNSCNAGSMVSSNGTGISVGKTYVVTYTVQSYSNGYVNIMLGNTSGAQQTAAGTYTEEIECSVSTLISFYSNGTLSVSNLSYYELVNAIDNSFTVSFYDGDGNDKKWASAYSFSPDLMVKYKNLFFSIKAGALWQHNVNPVMNNFYGVQYDSEVWFYDNENPTEMKMYYTMRVQATTPWACPQDGDISILPVLGRASGMSSRLKKGNFRNYQGSFYADFMRNQLDVRFSDPNQALYKGEPLRGRYMFVKLRNSDTTQSILFEVDIKSAASNITY